MNYYMPNIVINYWSLNRIYVIITVLIFTVFFVVNFYLFNMLQTKISIELNRNCNFPLAIYFSQKDRERCLNEKIENKPINEYPIFDNKVIEKNSRINKIINENTVENISTNFNNLKTSDDLEKTNTKLVDVSNNFYKMMNTDYGDMVNNTTNRITNFKKSITDSINDAATSLIQVGSDLGDKIVQNTVNRGWNTSNDVTKYNNIVKYLNIVTDPVKNPNFDTQIQSQVANFKEKIKNKNISKINAKLKPDGTIKQK